MGFVSLGHIFVKIAERDPSKKQDKETQNIEKGEAGEEQSG